MREIDERHVSAEALDESGLLGYEFYRQVTRECLNWLRRIACSAIGDKYSYVQTYSSRQICCVKRSTRMCVVGDDTCGGVECVSLAWVYSRTCVTTHPVLVRW